MRHRSKIKRTSFRQPTIYYRKPKKKNVDFGKIKIYFSKVAFVIYIFLALIYLIFFSSYFKIKEVIIDGTEISNKNEIASSVLLGHNILFTKNINMENDILSKFPEIKEVQIYKGIPNAIKVVVLEYDKSLVWQIGEKYYLVSSRGIVYKEITDKIADYTSLPRVLDKRNVAVSERQHILSPNFVSFTMNIIKDFKEYTNLEPDYFWVDETTMDLVLQTKEVIYVKFDTMRSSKKQLTNLKNVLISKRAEINEYVDVRIDGWAYIK